MGYRSEVAYAIVLAPEQDKTKIIDKLTPEQWELIKDAVTVEPDRILFHETYVKWYENFPDVAAHKALLEAAQEAQFDYEFGEDPAEGVNNLGIFMRLGEDSDDFERDAWGEDSWEGAPQWYDLVDERREITVGWEESS